MITLPADVQQGDNWSGTSVDSKSGDTVKNLDSRMTFQEHQRIVVGAKGLIESLDYPQDECDANKAKAALMRLKDAYTSNDSGVVYIAKGIHQPASNPHIQLSVEKDGETTLYHLDVSAHTIVTDHAGNEHFHWRGVCFSARIKNDKPGWDPEQYDTAFWPVGAMVTPKSYKARRNSISGPGLVKLDEAIDEENARRKAESDKALKRNSIVADISTKLGLSPKDKHQLKKLWEGGAAIFVTKTRKEVSCTYDGTHFIHNNGQKMAV